MLYLKPKNPAQYFEKDRYIQYVTFVVWFTQR